MTLDDLIRFSDDLRTTVKLDNTVRRKGDQIVIKIKGKEFCFSEKGKYLGTRAMHSSIADLVATMDTTPIDGLEAIQNDDDTAEAA